MTYDLDELKRLHAAATPGPWRQDGNGCLPNQVGYDGEWDESIGQVIVTCERDGFERKAVKNAMLVAALYNAFPAMAEEIDRLRTEIRELKGFVQ